MCLAVPGKILEVTGEIALADFNGIQKEINVSLIKAAVGEYVVVHAGFAIEKTDEKSAKEAYQFLNQ
ncbi:HypC/HybG/HupF family hydrogenase formation chaperone [Candidatus Falkowbacteria bacterium]|nr:HypC/HybG/HupF family hydrogenase formation chaperone [Candidatus Falkowbacteria bacterium]